MANGIYFKRNYHCGFGTWPLTGKECHAALLTAAEVGYRAFDTAQMYQNEEDTGAALKETGIDRDELFITTKVDLANYSSDRFLSSVEGSLRDLQTDFIDVLLLHWPPADFNIKPALELLVSAHERGYARHIGISNFTAQMMRDAKAFVQLPLAVNQVEFHPLLNQSILLAAAQETEIPLSAYCSVARGEVFKYPLLEQIGTDYGKTSAQVTQKWILQKGVSVNTMSTNPVNIRANLELDDFELSAAHMAQIDELNQQNYRIVNKTLVPFAPDFD